MLMLPLTQSFKAGGSVTICPIMPLNRISAGKATSGVRGVPLLKTEYNPNAFCNGKEKKVSEFKMVPRNKNNREKC